MVDTAQGLWLNVGMTSTEHEDRGAEMICDCCGRLMGYANDGDDYTPYTTPAGTLVCWDCPR